MAVAAIGFARELPEDARLLLTIRPSDLLDGEPDAAFQDTLAAMNAPLIERVGEARGEPAVRGPSTCHGRFDAGRRRSESSIFR